MPRDVDIIDWNKVHPVVQMVAERVMERSDMQFGPIIVKIYNVGEVLRIDIQNKEY